jgi:transcriptional regulator GlxA family with amidase domain
MQVLRGVHDEFKRLMPLHLGSPEMGRIAAVVRKMREHPERRWTVESLAGEVGCSRSSFAAKFQSYAGVGPIHFAARTRLEHAQSLLRSNPDLPIWEVAKRVGYDAQGSFTRAFKGQFGKSPRRFVEEVRRGT